MNNALDILRNNSVFWSKLGYCYDPPKLDENGQEILFAEDFDRFIRIQKDFTDSGIKIVSSILFTGWIGVDKFDYTLTDKVLDAVFKEDSDIYYIPRIKLNVPIDWCKENPEEVFVYYDGPRDIDGIQKLVGTSEHDILGYDGEKGYQNTFGYTDDRPNIGGKISLQSFSSQKWLEEAGDALRRIIQRLENSQYANRILAYHIAYGVCGETCVWGRFRKKFPGDWGITNSKEFYKWGINKYGSEDSLKDVWFSADVSSERAYPPAPDKFAGEINSLAELFRARPEDKVCVDYELFTTDMNINAMEYFGRIVKELTSGKPVGYFYGYVLECENAAYSGWLGYDRLLASEYIDFIAAPKSYYRNAPGEPGGFLGLAQSINRKKIWMDEIDNQTHLAKNSSCKNVDDTKNVLCREFAKNISAGTNFWWMDLGGGWYDDSEIMSQVKKLEAMAQQVRAKEHKSIADVLIIIDERCAAQFKRGSSLHQNLFRSLLREFSLSGSAYDIYRLNDLNEIDISNYKLIVPLNLFNISREQFEKQFKNTKDDVSYLWFYAPGVVTAKGLELDNFSKMTGIKINERKAAKEIRVHFKDLPDVTLDAVDANLSLPLLEIADVNGLDVLGHYSDGSPAVCTKGNNFYCAVPFLESTHLNWFMQKACCKLYVEAGNIIYADNRFEFKCENDVTTCKIND